MRRYIITLGSSTSAGGKVISASGGGSINGIRIALEGDAIFCPACKSQGKIVCFGPRLPEMWNGKQLALEDDHCVCGCPTPPKLIPSQTLRSQNMAPPAASPLESEDQTRSAANPEADTQQAATFDMFFVLQDERSGQALAGMPYKITLASGKTLTGLSDARGHSRVISSASPEIATIEAPYHGNCNAETYPIGGSDACDC